MATYASRPAWGLRARTAASARIVVPAGLGLLVGLSLLLRTSELNVGYWVDEGLSVGIAHRPLLDIPGILRQDGSPPLFYCLLNVWISVFGTTEKATHVLSLLFALLAIPVAYWGASAAFGRRAGWMAAALAALNPFATQYAQETRMYALVMLLGLLATSLFLHAYVRDERPARWRPVAFGVALVLALYTHNWALFFGFSLFVAWLVLLALAPREERRWRLLDGALGFGTCALLYLPWVPSLLFQAAHTGAPWSRRPGLMPELTEDVPHRLLGHTAWLVLVLGVGAGVVAVLRASSVRRWGAQARGVVALLIVALGTVLLAYLASQLSPAWADRYLAIALPPLLLLVAAGLASARGLGLAALVIVALLWAYEKPPSLKSNVRQVSGAISPSLAPGDVVVSTQPEQIPVLAHYLPPGLRYATLTGFVPDIGVTDWIDGVKRLRATSAARDLRPVMDSVAPGHRLVLISPIIFDLARWRAPWTELVRVRSEEFNQYVTNDPRFHATAIFPPEPRSRVPNPVAATVLVRTAR
jgi:hypothetical protein